MFLGASRTDSNCHYDIGPSNIFPGDICQYQEYLSCYQPDFDETLKVGFFDHLTDATTVMMIFGLNIVGSKICLNSQDKDHTQGKPFAVTNFISLQLI